MAGTDRGGEDLFLKGHATLDTKDLAYPDLAEAIGAAEIEVEFDEWDFEKLTNGSYECCSEAYGLKVDLEEVIEGGWEVRQE